MNYCYAKFWKLVIQIMKILLCFVSELLDDSFYFCYASMWMKLILKCWLLQAMLMLSLVLNQSFKTWSLWELHGNGQCKAKLSWSGNQLGWKIEMMKHEEWRFRIRFFVIEFNHCDVNMCRLWFGSSLEFGWIMLIFVVFLLCNIWIESM